MLLEDSDLCAALGSSKGCLGTRMAAADHNHIRIVSCGDLSIINDRGFTQPVLIAHVAEWSHAGLLGCFHGNLNGLALGLGNAGCSGGLGSGRGHGGGGNGVEVGALGVHNRLLEVFPVGAADGGGLLRHVYLDVGDVLGVKGHGNGDDALRALGFSAVGAGNIGAAFLRKGDGGAAQNAARHYAEGADGALFQEIPPCEGMLFTHYYFSFHFFGLNDT